MLYYRFRPTGELALKELLYDEIFLASAAECNDPYDGMTLLAFGPERDKWHRLFDLAWHDVNLPEKSKLIAELVGRVVADCPLPYAKAMEYDYGRVILELFPSLAAMERALALRITSLLDIYRPHPPYFASFSQNCENILMWSHYASMHQGHCLIFRDLDGQLKQCPRRMRRSIHRETSRGLAPNMSYGFPAGFQFHDISYPESTEIMDAFSYLPASVYGKKLSETERMELIQYQQRQVLTKHHGWRDEQEVRVTFYPGGSSWLFGEHLECTQLERLIHFQPTQLVGLILGARTSAHQQSRIREICQARLDRISVDIGKHGVDEPFFDFVIFQAGLCNDRRDISINPLELLSLGQSIVPEDEKFVERLERWRQGWALVFHENGARKQQFA